MSELKNPTKERVLAAAAKCDTARDVLKEMWPEVFEAEFKVGDRVYVDYPSNPEYSGPGTILQVDESEPRWRVQLNNVQSWASVAWIHTKDLRPPTEEPWEDVTDRVMIEKGFFGGFCASVPRLSGKRRTFEIRSLISEEVVHLETDDRETEFRILPSGRIERRRKR